jgi:hypothetical protein
VNGLESISAKCLKQLGFYIKIFIILYADDTVIMSETEEGIQQALLNFEQYCDLWKNGKYSGIDGVINEYIKYTIYDMLHIYVLLFNIILDKGIISESWGKGILIPIFKNKGSKSNSNSYRRVTLNSCINKNVFCRFK